MRSEFYRDDVPTEENMRYSASTSLGLMVGGAMGNTPEQPEALPLGLHFSQAERQQHRLTRAGIVVVRKVGGR